MNTTLCLELFLRNIEFDRVIEKAAIIYSQVGTQCGKILQEIAEYFNTTPYEGFLDV